MNKQIRLDKVKEEEKSKYLEYLLLADDSEAAVNEYMYDGEMFSIFSGGNLAGIALFTFPSDRVVELKNIALAPAYRGKGVGKLVVNAAVELYANGKFHKMIVGTANSSLGNLAFYQKVGFRMTDIKRDFFANYPSPIVEEGIRAMDMVMFEKNLPEH